MCECCRVGNQGWDSGFLWKEDQNKAKDDVSQGGTDTLKVARVQKHQRNISTPTDPEVMQRKERDKRRQSRNGRDNNHMQSSIHLLRKENRATSGLLYSAKVFFNSINLFFFFLKSNLFITMLISDTLNMRLCEMLPVVN